MKKTRKIAPFKLRDPLKVRTALEQLKEHYGMDPVPKTVEQWAQLVLSERYMAQSRRERIRSLERTLHTTREQLAQACRIAANGIDRLIAETVTEGPDFDDDIPF